MEQHKPDRKVLQLARLAGPGEAVLSVRPEGAIEHAWPLAALGWSSEAIILMPPMGRLIALLTPEVMVLQRVEGGIRMTGRRTLPLFARGGIVGPFLIHQLLD